MNVCPFSDCQRCLSTRYKLKLHIQRHHYNIKKYICVHCLKAFKSSDSLKRHSLRHQSSPKVSDTLKSPIFPSSPHIDIPKLTALLVWSKDVDLIPNVHVEKLFPFTSHRSIVILPAIENRSAN